MTMCDKELLVGYMYDEVEPAERRAFESHLLACAECRTELKGLRAVRTRLGSWTPKEPELEFQIVRRPPAAVARSWMRSPVWALAAAAVLVLAVASAIANVEVKYGSDGLTVRTGWARVPAQAAGVPAVTTIAGGDQALRVQLQTINQRLRDLESSAATRPVMTTMHAAAVQTPQADLMRQVRQLLADSENRQERELALRIGQVLRDVEGARRVDFDRVQRSLAEVQGVADTTILRQREMENHIYRVVQQK